MPGTHHTVEGYSCNSCIIVTVALLREVKIRWSMSERIDRVRNIYFQTQIYHLVVWPRTCSLFWDLIFLLCENEHISSSSQLVCGVCAVNWKRSSQTLAEVKKKNITFPYTYHLDLCSTRVYNLERLFFTWARLKIWTCSQNLQTKLLLYV